MTVRAAVPATCSELFAGNETNHSSCDLRQSELVSMTTTIIILTIFGIMIRLMVLVPIAQRQAKNAVDTLERVVVHERS